MDHALPICRILLLGILSLAFTTPASARTFTSPDGRTLDAEIQSATAQNVTLQLAAGPVMTVPINKFSQADQAYITEWRKAHPVTIRYDFSPSFTKSKTNTAKSSRGNEEITTESWVCNVKLMNRSGQTLDKLKVNYEIFHSQMNGADFVVRKTTGSTALDSLKHHQEINFQTRDVKLVTLRLDGGFYYSDGSRSRRKESIEGITLKVVHEGKAVYQWDSPGVPKSDASERPGTAAR
jgi:hypothetical protein